ncbi:MAG: hypothetical protein ACXW3Z_14775 [Limisphaerales bacterium]
MNPFLIVAPKRIKKHWLYHCISFSGLAACQYLCARHHQVILSRP